MQIALLGPLRVDGGAGEMRLAAAKERSLLAVLALSPGAVVSTDALISALWGERPPASARKTLQTYVVNVRRALGPTSIDTEPPGYRLAISPDHVDVLRFRRLVREGEEALRRGATAEARAALGAAVALWRGEPFAEAASHTSLAGERVRLKEEYLSASEARIAADLDAGLRSELVGELEALTREHPFRERLWAQLMLAHYRCGRQADALAAYQRARETLAEQLGLEPGGELRRMEAAVLAHDSALERPTGPAGGPTTAVAAATATEPTRSPVRYAKTEDGAHIAYQLVGDGPIDILAIPGFVTHLDIWWAAPTHELVRRLAGIGRLILFDKRGMGLSDRPAHVEPEQWVEDARAVLDAVGAKDAIVFGISAGGPTALLLAARHPDRVRALALYGAYARVAVLPEPERLAKLNRIEREWGTGVGIEALGGSRGHDPSAREYWARYQRIAASPAAAVAFLRALGDADVRDVLPSITVPTLVLHPARDRSVPLEHAREVAEALPDSRLVELNSDVHLIWLSDVTGQIADELEAFVADVVAPSQRALLTLVSLRPASGHDRAIVASVERHAGRLSLDGRRATFPGVPGAALRCAVEVAVRSALGVGVHAGECEVRGEAVGGPAVDLADGIAARAKPGEVLASQTVRDLMIGSDVEWEDRGVVDIPGAPTGWRVFALARGPATDLRF